MSGMTSLLVEKRNELLAQSRTLIDRVEAEKRGLTTAEKSELDQLMGDSALLRAKIEEAAETRSASTYPNAPKVPAGYRHNLGSTEVRYGRPLPAGASFSDLPGAASTEESHRALGQYVADIVERRGQAIGTGSAGGFMVPTPISTNLIGATVARCRTVEAGAAIIPMESETLTVPTVDGLPTVGWRAESALIPESTAVFGRVKFTAQTAACMVRVSMEAMEDIDQFGQILETTLAQAAAVEIDRVGLYGSGLANQPVGLRNQLIAAGRVTSLGTNGGNANYGSLVSAAALVKGRAYEPTAAILSPRTEASLALVTDTLGQYVRPPAYLDGLKQLAAPGLPTNVATGTASTTTDAFVGDFRFLAYGLRTAVSIRVLDQTYAATGEIGILAWLRLDVQTLRPDAFQMVSGILN